MAIQAISTIESKPKKTHFVSGAVLGAAIGAGARYIAPTKNEIGQIFNKDTFKKVMSKANTAARGESRSILKFAGLGALTVTGLNLIGKAISGLKTEQNNLNFDYSKYGAFFDSGDCACEIMWLG